MIGLSILLVFVLAALLAWALNHLALIPFRRASSAHWTERARILWPVRQGTVLGGAFGGQAIVLLAGALWPQLSDSGWALAWVVATCAGALLAGFTVHQAAFPARKLIHWLAFMLTLGALRIVPVFLWMVVGAMSAMGSRLWQEAFYSVFLLQVVLSLGLWVWPLRWLGLLKPASSSLQSAVDELSQTMGIPVRRVWETAPVTANALAVPLWSALIISRETISVLSAVELRSVLAHELGHLSEPWHVSLRRILGAFWLLPLAFSGWIPLAAGNVLVACVACYIWLRIALLLARSEERRVDAVAAQVAGGGEISARALEKLHEAALIPANFRTSGMTHPALYDRMLAVGITPDYPRPPVPARFAINSWLGMSLLVVSVLISIMLPPSSHEKGHAPRTVNSASRSTIKRNPSAPSDNQFQAR